MTKMIYSLNNGLELDADKVARHAEENYRKIMEQVELLRLEALLVEAQNATKH